MGNYSGIIIEAEKPYVGVYAENMNLKALQDAVGGYIEHVSISKGIGFICNEDGHNLGLPLNMIATMLYGFSSPVVGNIVIVRTGYVDGEMDFIKFSQEEALRICLAIGISLKFKD